MKREDVHRCWAPANERWTPWVKPVLFAHLDEDSRPRSLPSLPESLCRRVVESLLDAASNTEAPAASPYRSDRRVRDTAIVIDLPGEAGALVGVALTAHAIRPIPLYNAVPHPGGLIDLKAVMRVLVDGAERVAGVASGAAPAFMLDADRNRFGHAAIPGAFDNRSICRESDFPSAETLWQAGIRRALLIQATNDLPAIDLEAVLFGWQRRGIGLWIKNVNEADAAAPFVLRRRAWMTRLMHRVHGSFLRLREDGAYGMIVPGADAGGG